MAAFDLDGTLLDSATSIVDGVFACWDACGFSLPDPDRVRRIIGLPWEESVRALLPEAGEAEFAQIRAYYEEVAQGRRARPERGEALFEGALETLEDLHAQGYALAIVTSRTGSRLVELLRNHRIADYFLTFKTADMGPGKPKPDLLLAAMADAGADAAGTVMIGDTTFDIEMAINAGTSALGVSWGVHDVDELSRAGAHRIADAFDDVRASVAAMTDGR